MVDRVKLLDDIYMPIEGQWAIIRAGSVIDVPDKAAFATQHISVLSPGEPAGSLKNAAHARPIRSVVIK